MSGFSRDRNIKIPKKGEKKSPSKRTDFLPSRPAEGRAEIPKKTAKPQNNQQRRSNNLAKITKGAEITIAIVQGNKSQDRKDLPHSMMKFGQE